MRYSEYFNSASAKTLATVDENGWPNVCPCGTAKMSDEHTIIMGCVGIVRSRENIRKLRKATFMAQKPINPDYWKQYEATGEKPYPAGYRFYCTFVEETEDKALMIPIYERLKDRVGGRIADKIVSVMKFKVEEVREIDF